MKSPKYGSERQGENGVVRSSNLWKRLHEIRGMKNLKRDALVLKLGAAKQDAGKAWGLVDIQLPDPREAVTPETFGFQLNRKKLRKVRRDEGTYLTAAKIVGKFPNRIGSSVCSKRFSEDLQIYEMHRTYRPVFASGFLRKMAQLFNGITRSDGVYPSLPQGSGVLFSGAVYQK